KGPHDYDLTWEQKGNVQGSFRIKVRNGKAVSVMLNGSPLEERLYPNYTMTALFEFIEEFLRQDDEQKRRPFTTATFEPADGHITRFIRKVIGTSELQDISLELTRAAPA